MKSISIVIVTWNCRKLMEECLESLGSYRRDPQVEIIVVDNGSRDGTPELVRDFYPEVMLIQCKENLGFTKANNIGIRRSSGKYVCLVNPDVLVLGGCIETMVGYMKQNPRIGLLGPRMLGVDGKSYRSYMGAPTLWNMFCRALALDALFPNAKLFGGFLMPYFNGNQIAEVDILTGWFWVTHRQALREVGLLDERLFMYADDLDWSKRFRDAGWKVVYFPAAESIHYGGGTTNRAPVRFSVEMQKANFQYWQKYYGRASQLMYLVIIWIHQVIRLVGYSLLSLNPKSDRGAISFKLKRSIACLQWVMGIPYRRGVKAESGIHPEIGSC